MAGADTPGADMPARLATAAREVDETRTAYRLAVQLRNALVVAMVDEGWTQHSVSRLAGIDRKTMIEIVARSDAGV